TVALTTGPTLFLFAEMEHAPLFVLPQDLAGDLGAGDGRPPHLRSIAAEHQHFVEAHIGARVALDLLDAQHVALGDTVLLSTGSNDGVHRSLPLAKWGPWPKR